jgi:hypothetical protein
VEKFVVQDLSGDAEQICATLDAPQIRDGTPILQALSAGYCILKGSTRSSRKMVFLTDGQGPRADEVIALATTMKAEGIDIFTMSIGVGADTALMNGMASTPTEEFSYHVDDFDSLLTGDFIAKFVKGVECKAQEKCECWNKPDLLVCPLVSAVLGYTCGERSTGEFYFDCTDDERAAEDSAYVLWNFLAWIYKLVFLLSLRFLLDCHTIDVGKVNILCFQFVPLAWVFLGVVNAALILLTYLFRCIMPVWAVFFFIFLHIDVVVCIADRVMNRKLIAPPKPPPPRSNLELFAYTNNKKGWKEKAYNTFELRGAKKQINKDAGKTKAANKAAAARRESALKKGFSMKGAGMI